MNIFIAGPLTNGGRITDPKQILRNVWAAMDVANQLIFTDATEYIVYCPHLMWYLWRRTRKAEPERLYIKQSLAWLRDCDALVRLPGKSRGADIELVTAAGAGKAIYYWDYVGDRNKLLGGEKGGDGGCRNVENGRGYPVSS